MRPKRFIVKFAVSRDGTLRTTGYLQLESSWLVDTNISLAHLDSAKILSLNNIAANGYGAPARGAMAVLRFFYNYPYETQLVLPTFADSSRMLRVNLSTSDSVASIVA